jgi:hypothetical protein
MLPRRKRRLTFILVKKNWNVWCHLWEWRQVQVNCFVVHTTTGAWFGVLLKQGNPLEHHRGDELRLLDFNRFP